MMLTSWLKSVAELRSQYNWLLFFSVPKLLLLYHLLKANKPNLEAIVHEISFLCYKDQAAWESTQKKVEVSVQWKISGWKMERKNKRKKMEERREE